MVSEVKSGMVYGIEGEVITVQADISDGLPIFYMIGYLSAEVKEAKERVRTALKNSGFFLPPKRVAVNLAPADRKKCGTCFDLAIAVCLLVAMGVIAQEMVEGIIFLGELALDGSLLTVDCVLPVLYRAGKEGYHKCILPMNNVDEASLLADVEIVGAESLKDVFTYLTGVDKKNVYIKTVEVSDSQMFPADGRKVEEDEIEGDIPDFRDVKGQKMAKRAIEIAVAGYHNLFLDGPPGAGKSLLASCIPGIMPHMNHKEMIDTTMIYSVKGLLKKGVSHVGRRPYRSPGHSISPAGMFGGGTIPKPGEISLAHHGVLFLDEFAEYKKEMLEMFRIPLEQHRVLLTRNGRQYDFPCDFILIVAANPCPCGFYPDRRLCRCSVRQIERYQNKLSGPILDRIDMFVHCEKVSFQELTERSEEESSWSIRQRIECAWEIQKDRFEKKSYAHNGRMDRDDMEKYCQLNTVTKKLMERAFETFHLTGRSYYRILKTARTIADLEGQDMILQHHLEEALLFRKAGNYNFN